MHETEKKGAAALRLYQATARERERFLEGMLAGVRGMIYRADDRGRFAYVSDGAVGLCGVSPDRLVHTETWQAELVIQADAARRAAALAGAAMTDEPFVVDYRFRHADGTVRWARETGQLRVDMPDRPASLIGLVVDITDLKQAEGEPTRPEEGGGGGLRDWRAAVVATPALEMKWSGPHPIAPGPRGQTAARAAPADALAGKRLLLVDDDPDMLEILGAALDGLGADVVLAQSAPEGLARCMERGPDLVVSDLGMPGEDGYSFIAKLRRLRPEEGAGAPAIALTAYSGAEVRARALRAGFDVHLNKPIDPEELVAVLAGLAGWTRPSDRAQEDG